MTIGPRAPLSPEEQCHEPAGGDPVRILCHSLAEMEARAWILDRQLAAVLIGAARLSLRDRVG